jgi:hypothetical protein
MNRRIVWIKTSAGKYYESHEVEVSGRWAGVDFFDLTESDANTPRPNVIGVDVSNVIFPNPGEHAIASGVLCVSADKTD